jgi:hypothetical protein
MRVGARDNGRFSIFEPPLSETPKHQTPSSREVPNLKLQAPKTDAGENGAQVVL